MTTSMRLLSLHQSQLGVPKKSDGNQELTRCHQPLEVVEGAKNRHCNMVNNKVHQKLIQKVPAKLKKEAGKIMKAK
jgi:hypothetical protein